MNAIHRRPRRAARVSPLTRLPYRSEIAPLLPHENIQSIRRWSNLFFRSRPELHGHSQRVSRLAGRLAHAMGLEARQQQEIQLGALLHDIGKSHIDPAILDKPGNLTKLEKERVNLHPLFGAQMLDALQISPNWPEHNTLAAIVLHHHEQWSGAGYPFGLRGTEIPLAARICAVADVWDALRSDRPYRKGKSYAEVMDFMSEHSGSHFDPHIVAIFSDLMQRGYASRPRISPLGFVLPIIGPATHMRG
jgi:putative two-component system response regulator